MKYTFERLLLFHYILYYGLHKISVWLFIIIKKNVDPLTFLCFLEHRG